MNQKRSFKVHPAILFSVIRQQAGTLSKAIAESLMNSIDAGATCVAVTLTNESYTVRDDGRGFQSMKEIEEFFETFGTPHNEGDAVYGRFRIGRGQGFAFAKHKWTTGEFIMDVDVKNKGIDYDLKQDQPHFHGCLIEAELYERLSPTEFQTTKRMLIELCQYTPIPIFLNDVKLTKDINAVDWDHETDEAYISIKPSTKLSVYNLGVLVSHFNAHEFGTGGIVVSKKQLDLNMARNDIMRNSCQVWKKIKPYLKSVAEKINKQPTKITEEFRAMKAMELLGVVGTDYAAVHELFDAPVFTDISGKHYSVNKLLKGRAVTSAKAGDFTADRISQHGIAIVLNEALLISRFDLTLPEILTHLKDSGGLKGNHYAERLTAQLHQAYAPLTQLAQGLNTDHEILDLKKLTPQMRIALDSLNYISYMIARRHAHLGKVTQTQTRSVLPMESEVAEAFTDGEKTIYIHKKWLCSGDSGPDSGLVWAINVVNLLAHEYCHDFNSGVGHTHDSEFYQAYHELILGTDLENFGVSIGYISKSLFIYYCQRAVNLANKLNKNVGRHLDILDRNDQRMKTTSPEPRQEKIA